MNSDYLQDCFLVRSCHFDSCKTKAVVGKREMKCITEKIKLFLQRGFLQPD